MTGETHDGRTEATDSASTTQQFADPEILLERDDVEYHEKASEDHQHHFETYEPIDGMAVAGVTNDEGAVLLLVNRDAGHAMLPYGRVEPGEDWAAVARSKTEELTDVAVTIDGPERVRRKRYRPEGSAEADERETTGYDVVFRASPVADETVADDVNACHEDDWDVGWFTELPVDADEGNGDVIDDVRLFID